jgi:hypothetical protein
VQLGLQNLIDSFVNLVVFKVFKGIVHRQNQLLSQWLIVLSRGVEAAVAKQVGYALRADQVENLV